MKIVNVEEMRRIEQLTDANGHSYAAMMELAGRAVADAAMMMRLIEPEDSILLLVGPGNNGGDGLVAARFLRERGHDVVIYIWKRDIKGDENFRLLKRRRRGVAILWAENDSDFAKLREEVSRTSLIIDALLGTGVTRPLDGRLAELLTVIKQEVAERRRLEAEEEADFETPLSQTPILEALMLGAPVPGPRMTPVDANRALASGGDETLAGDTQDEDDEDDDSPDNELDDWWLDEDEDASPWPPAPVLAIDCPSGLNCDTGEIDASALPADVTVTFAYPKRGQVQFPGAEACGLLHVADIGVPQRFADPVTVELVSPSAVQRLLPLRSAGGHKGTFGKALVVGGSIYYTGAIVLAGGAAVRAGAGLVTAAIPLPLHAAVAGSWPELTWLPLPGPEGTHTSASAPRLIESAERYDVLLVGPGLTASEETGALLGQLLGPHGLAGATWAERVVVDADALTLLSALPDWHRRLPPRSILTPHPGEMQRLTGLTPAEINAQRIQHAQHFAAEWGHIVVLKGPHTVIAAPDGRVCVLPFASAALATAGSGDVLAGVIVGLLAQGLSAFDAAVAGAYVHAFAGILVARAIGEAGGTVRDILLRVPDALHKVRTGSF